MDPSSFTLGLARDIAGMAMSAANLNPISGAGFLVSIVLSLYKSDHNYKQEFREINNKLDKIEMKIDDLSNLVANIAATNTYLESHNSINHQMRNLIEYMQASASTKDIKRDAFFHAYEESNNDMHLWSLNSNLEYVLSTFAKTSNYNKKYVTNVGEMLMESMMMGISCSYSYEFLKNRNYDEALIRWKGEIYKLTKMIASYTNQCVQMAPISAKNDIKKSLSHYDDTSNQQQFTNRLHQLLTSTYDWLSWMVIVYDRDVQSSLNVFKSQGGIHVKGNKNVVAFYYDNRQKPITSFNAVNKALGRFFQPRVIASNMYYFLRSYGVTGEIFVCRVIYDITAEYDRSYGMATTSGRLFVAKFGY